MCEVMAYHVQVNYGISQNSSRIGLQHRVVTSDSGVQMVGVNVNCSASLLFATFVVGPDLQPNSKHKLHGKCVNEKLQYMCVKIGWMAYLGPECLF